MSGNMGENKALGSWTTKEIPNLHGKVAIVTGGTRGIGLHTAIGLASAGADVVILGRNPNHGEMTVANIKARLPSAKVSYSQVEFASLKEIAEFAKTFNERGEALDILVNNAGTYPSGNLEKTMDGFESTFGINHLAPFALTAQLLPSLKKSRSPRIINVSSTSARHASINFDDLHYEKAKYYLLYKVYAQSKLANLLFTAELQKMSDFNGWGLTVLSTSPGLVTTDMFHSAFDRCSIMGQILKYIPQHFFTHNAETGAQYSLYAATSPDVIPNTFYGPTNRMTCIGPIDIIEKPAMANDSKLAQRLWKVSEYMSGVTWG